MSTAAGWFFIYLEHLWRIRRLPGRPWPGTALSSCLASEGQQRINHSEDKEIQRASAAGSSPPFGQRETVTGNHICGKKCMTGLSAAPPEGDLEKVGAEE